MKDSSYPSGSNQGSRATVLWKKEFIIRMRIYTIGQVTRNIRVQKGLFKDQRTVTKQPRPQSGRQVHPAAAVALGGEAGAEVSFFVAPTSVSQHEA